MRDRWSPTPMVDIVVKPILSHDGTPLVDASGERLYTVLYQGVVLIDKTTSPLGDATREFARMGVGGAISQTRG